MENEWGFVLPEPDCCTLYSNGSYRIALHGVIYSTTILKYRSPKNEKCLNSLHFTVVTKLYDWHSSVENKRRF